MIRPSTLLPLATSPTSFWLQADGWDQFPGLVHGFSNRIEDRNLALSRLNAEVLSLYTVKQVHGDEILIVHQESDTSAQPEADGLMSRASGMLLGIATADCVPMLMVVPKHGLIAALHAGWRGTLKGISQRAVKMLNDRWHIAPENVWVALGPSISSCCYEVGRDVGEAFHERWSAAAAWQPQGGKGFLDLRFVNRVQCERAGIPASQIQLVGPCTFCASADFASYRREGAGAGRQLSVIGWQKD
jgi:YfiH family protein